MKRVLLPDLNIPYASITSVDWTNQWHTSLKLGGIPIVRGMGKRIIMVRDVSGFLDELEHHVESSVLHV